jgi:hypothetical protein
MKNRRFVLFAALLLLQCSYAFAGQPPAILPASFSGWQKNAVGAKSGTDPVLADPVDAAVLREYRFSDAELATYGRDDRTMQVKAVRFSDATGAYGAFTFYQQPQMRSEKIGDQGASNNRRILFYRGNVLVDVLLDRVTAMSAADLRTLAAALPQVQGESAAPPNLDSNLPRHGLIPHTERFIRGPVAMERLGVSVPAALVDFNMSPEMLLAQYASSWGEGNLLLIDYPTHQIAMEKIRAIQAASLPGGPYYFKRTGPIVAIVSGNIPGDEAQTLLASVNWDANVTITQSTKPDFRNNVFSMLSGIIMLIGAILLLALIFGFAFGGFRLLAKKFFPNKVFDRPEDMEIIRLNLK